MLYTGCRTNEASGLQVRDFRLEANTPHVVFRTNELMGIKNPDLVPYSTRHTFRDRSEAANISTSRSEYIMGHKSAASSRIHQKYGTKTPPTVRYEDMTKIFKVTDWGYYED